MITNVPKIETLTVNQDQFIQLTSLLGPMLTIILNSKEGDNLKISLVYNHNSYSTMKKSVDQILKPS